MENLSYVATAGGSLISILIVRWTFHRFDIGGKRLVRGAVAGGAILVGLIAYFVLGFIFLLIRPEHAPEIGAAIGGGFGVGAKIILAATIVCVFALSRRKPVGGLKPKA